VLEVRAIGAAGVTLRNAQGREGLVKWDTLRDPDSRRIRLTYGDVLSIDATQGLTSTEHIEAMPAGTRAVNAYKAYTGASRHRRSTWLIASDGAERQEIAGRRPLGDSRIIREADVWANMGRNLARTPQKASALDFLERARDVRRGAIRSLQAGLQPGEQRQAEGLEKTKLTAILQRRAAVPRLTATAEQLQQVVAEHGLVLQRLSGVAQAVREMVRHAMQATYPLLQQAVQQIRQRREFAALRISLLDERMAAWQRTKPQDATPEDERAVRRRQQQEIAAIPDAQLQQVVAAERQRQEAERQKAEREAAPVPSRGMSFGM
jgi:hypothetical protein